MSSFKIGIFFSPGEKLALDVSITMVTLLESLFASVTIFLFGDFMFMLTLFVSHHSFVFLTKKTIYIILRLVAAYFLFKDMVYERKSRNECDEIFHNKNTISTNDQFTNDNQSFSLLTSKETAPGLQPDIVQPLFPCSPECLAKHTILLDTIILTISS